MKKIYLLLIVLFVCGCTNSKEFISTEKGTPQNIDIQKKRNTKGIINKNYDLYKK